MWTSLPLKNKFAHFQLQFLSVHLNGVKGAGMLSLDPALFYNLLKRFFMKPTQQKLELLFRKLQLQNMKVILVLQWASVSLVKWVYLLCLK